MSDIATVKAAIDASAAEIKAAVAKATEEAGIAGRSANETRAELNALLSKWQAAETRLLDLEQREAGRAAGDKREQKDFATQFAESKAMDEVRGKQRPTASMEFKTAIINQFPPSANAPLVTPYRLPEIIRNPDRILRIRQLLPTMPVSNTNLIQIPKENVFTNNAGPQVGAGSPTQVENVAKPESGITFTLQDVKIITLAHNIPASRQVLDDAPLLEAFIRQRLVYGLELEEEIEILTGTGTGEELNGLINQATAVSTSASGDDTKIDVVRRLITALQQDNFQPEAIVLNPSDWQDIELTKDADGRYIFANPQNAAQPLLWGVPVVPSNTMTAGQVLVGQFSQAAMLFDRMTLTLELFREHSDFAAKNMVLMQAEKRVGLAVHRPLGLRKATF